MDFLKDAGINFASKTLDDCIYYLVNEISQKDRNFHIAQIVNTIKHFSIEMDEGRESFISVNEHFTRLKNDRIKERGLTSHRDADFSKFYIVICFFMFCANAQNKSSQIGANKILTMCENSVDIGIKDAVLEVTTPFRIIFNGGRAAPVQKEFLRERGVPEKLIEKLEDSTSPTNPPPVDPSPQLTPTNSLWNANLIWFFALAILLFFIFMSSPTKKKNIEIPAEQKAPAELQSHQVNQPSIAVEGAQNAVQSEQTNNSVSQAVVETRLRIEQEVEGVNVATKMRNDLTNPKKTEIEERQKRQEAEKGENNGVLTAPTAPTQSLPPNDYIQSENLTWEPTQTTATWDNAQNICLHSTKLGYKWRQATAKELLSLYQKESNVLRIRGWTLGDTWSSNEGVFWGSNHNVVNLALGSGGVSSDGKEHYVACVADRR